MTSASRFPLRTTTRKPVHNAVFELGDIPAGVDFQSGKIISRVMAMYRPFSRSRYSSSFIKSGPDRRIQWLRRVDIAPSYARFKVGFFCGGCSDPMTSSLSTTRRYSGGGTLRTINDLLRRPWNEPEIETVTAVINDTAVGASTVMLGWTQRKIFPTLIWVRALLISCDSAAGKIFVPFFGRFRFCDFFRAPDRETEPDCEQDGQDQSVHRGAGFLDGAEGDGLAFAGGGAFFGTRCASLDTACSANLFTPVSESESRALTRLKSFSLPYSPTTSTAILRRPPSGSERNSLATITPLPSLNRKVCARKLSALLPLYAQAAA